MGLSNFVRNTDEKLWNAAIRNHDIVDLAKKVQEHLNETGIPNADRVDVQINESKATVSGEGLNQGAKEKVLITIGNISSIASVDDQVKISTPASESQFCTVKSGDTLSAIARQIYDNTNLYNQIFEANKPMLKNPNKIYPGRVLRIPEQ